MSDLVVDLSVFANRITDSFKVLVSLRLHLLLIFGYFELFSEIFVVETGAEAKDAPDSGFGEGF